MAKAEPSLLNTELRMTDQEAGWMFMAPFDKSVSKTCDAAAKPRLARWLTRKADNNAARLVCDCHRRRMAQSREYSFDSLLTNLQRREQR